MELLVTTIWDWMLLAVDPKSLSLQGSKLIALNFVMGFKGKPFLYEPFAAYYPSIFARRSCTQVPFKTAFLKNFKHLCWSLFFNEVAGWRPVTLLKKRHRHRCFPVNFEKCLKTLFHRMILGNCFKFASTDIF